MPRTSGVLVHPTALPGPHGIGDLGDSAFRFVDWLVSAAQRVWQVLPLGPAGSGHSPYASPSAFAGNPLLISLPWLAGDGLLMESDINEHPEFPGHTVDFDLVSAYKLPLLRKAFTAFESGAAPELRPRFEAFRDEHQSWLDDFALFMALKDASQGAGWMHWETGLALRDPEALAAAREEHVSGVGFHQFVQFQFFRQWGELRRYANDRDIQIIGDLPIYVALDSADVWAHRDLFRLNPDGSPIVVAGVPPDAFTTNGQLWGNPLYDWNANASDGFEWWIARVRGALTMVDLLRIDHFRAFAAGWVVPANDPTAATGHWERGPGANIFEAMRAALGGLPFIVEDLGVITPDVVALRETLELPGMKVLQFAFGNGPDDPYLPHNYTERSVVYPATHDNQTTAGWFASLPEWQSQYVQRYLGKDGGDISWDFIRMALASVADTAIAPLQDIMRLGDEARFNTPGRGEGNWSWRFPPHLLHPGLGAGLNELTTVYGRRVNRDEERGYDPYDYTAPNGQHRLQ